MRRRIRRIVKWTAVGLGLLIVVGIGTVLAVLHTDWGREQIRSRIVATMSETFPGGVEIRALEGSVIGDAVLRDVLIRDREGRPAIKVARLEVNLGLGALLGKRIVVEKLVAQGVAIELHKLPGQPVNLATMIQRSGEPLGMDVVLEDIRVEDAAVLLDINGRVDHVDDIAIAGTFSYAADGDIAARLGELTGTWRERQAPLDAHGDVLVADGVIESTSFDAQLDKIALVATDIRYASPTDARGSVTITAAADALSMFYPDSPPSAAAQLTLAVAPAPEPGVLGVAIHGAVAKSKVDGSLAITPAEQPLVSGSLRLTNADWKIFSPEAQTTAIDSTVLFAAKIDPARGTRGLDGLVVIDATGTFGTVRVDRLAVHAAIGNGRVALHARGDAPGDSVARVHGDITMDESGAYLVDQLRIIARTGDLSVLTGDRRLRGRASADLVASGKVGRVPELTISGTASARGLRAGTLRAAHATLALTGVQFDAAQPTRPTGRVTATLSGAAVDGRAIPTMRVTAASRGPGRYAVSARSTGPAFIKGGAPWSADADAVVALGADNRSATIRLGRYHLRTRGVEWAGAGGRVAVTPAQVSVTGVTGTLNGGAFAVDGEVGLGGRGDLRAKIRTKGVELAALDRALALESRGIGPLRGTADLAVDVTRTRGRTTGTVTGSVRGLAIRATGDPIDIDLDTKLTADRLVGTVHAQGRRLGVVDLELDLAPPRDLMDMRAWSKLSRAEIRVANVRATNLDLAEVAIALGVPPVAEGTVTADLALGATPQGRIVARHLVVPGVRGMLDIEVDLDLDTPGEVEVTGNASILTIAHADIAATLRVPARLFDIAAWKALDASAIRGGHVAVRETVIDSQIARRLGLGNVRGRFAAMLEFEPALAAVHVRAVGREVIGGPLERPVDVIVTGDLTGDRAAAQLVATLDGVTVLTGEVTAPIDPEWGASGLASTPIIGSITIQKTRLTTLVRLFGADRKVPGTVHGMLRFGGTIGDPTATAALVIEGLGNRQARIPKLLVDASYAEGKIALGVKADQVGGGKLVAAANIDLAEPAATTMSLDAAKFQIAPLARLVPEALVGVRGVVDADLDVKGLDPATAQLSGIVQVRDAQLPIVDTVGAITKGKIDVSFQPGKAHMSVEGAVESGQVKLVVDAVLDGMLPRTATIDLSAKNIELIMTMSPRLAADLHAEVQRVGDRWNVNARIKNAKVVIPEDADGTPLHAAGPPADMVFVEAGIAKTPPKTAVKDWLQSEPSAPLVVVRLRIDPIQIVSKDFRAEVDGKLDIVAGRDGFAITGRMDGRRGRLMVFNKPYLLERASLTFDGSLDPLVDIRLQREMADVTMDVFIAGRVSDPELELRSQPSIYSEGQLLGFMLGQSPDGSGMGEADARATVTGAGASIASQTLGGMVTKRLPVKVDVLRYEPATASESASFAVGKWFSTRLLVMIRSRIEPRVDENRAETELEYWLARRIVLDGVAGNRGVYGLDLLWTRRW